MWGAISKRIHGTVNVDGVECNSGNVFERLSTCPSAKASAASLIFKDRFEMVLNSSFEVCSKCLMGAVGGTIELETGGVEPEASIRV